MKKALRFAKYPYRKGVVGIVTNAENEFLLVQQVSYADNEWKFPSGGIESDETEEEGLLRELSEELNSKSFEIIKKSKHHTRYDWPENVIERLEKTKDLKFRGQTQTIFLVKFSGEKENIKPDEKEIKRHTWVKKEELNSHLLFPGERELAAKVLKEFGF